MLARHANSALYPIVDLLDRVLGLDGTASPPAGSRRSRRCSRLRLRSGGGHAALPPAPRSPFAAPYAPLDVSPQKKALTLSAVLSLLFEMAEKRPVLLVIEDLHWADPSTLELLGQLVGEVGSARVLAPPHRPARARAACSTTGLLQLQLGRLDRPQMEAMVAGGPRRCRSRCWSRW